MGIEGIYRKEGRVGLRHESRQLDAQVRHLPYLVISQIQILKAAIVHKMVNNVSGILSSWINHFKIQPYRTIAYVWQPVNSKTNT